MDEPELKIIDVFICKLRKKLANASNGKNFIETVWGRGYVLREPQTTTCAFRRSDFLTYPIGNIDQGRVDFRASAKLALRPAATRDRRTQPSLPSTAQSRQEQIRTPDPAAPPIVSGP